MITTAEHPQDALASAPVLEERWAAFHRYGPYVLLLFSVLVALGTASLVHWHRTEWYVAGGLVATGLVLQLWWGRADRLAGAPSTASVCYYFARWAVAFALSVLNPFFAFYAASGYFGAERLLPRRLIKPGLFVTAVVLAGSQAGGFPPHGTGGWALFGAMLAVNGGMVLVMIHLDTLVEARARAQAATIGELESTNQALQEALAENAALHAQLLVQAREAGIADERRRLAAEIHDTIAQGLTGIIAQLQVVANAPTRELARRHLDQAADLARHSLGEARRSVHNLAPVALADASLPDALRSTVAGWSERTGLRAEFTLTGTAEPLHEEIEATLLRIAEEALSNAARHARATRLGVTLSFMAGEVALDVRDDGQGFDPAALPARSGTGGFGLDGMRARAERVAGQVTVESEPGGGTAISARVPLVPHDQ